MGPTRELTLLAASEKMREYERRAKALNSKEETLAQVRSEWLVKTTQKQQGLTVKQRYEELKAKRNIELEERRSRLASKLMEEEYQYKQELLSLKETPEQRRERMTQRARELGMRREEERQQLAQSLYDRAFMENCDVLRDTNSKRVLYRTLEERNAQVRVLFCFDVDFHHTKSGRRLRLSRRWRLELLRLRRTATGKRSHSFPSRGSSLTRLRLRREGKPPSRLWRSK